MRRKARVSNLWEDVKINRYMVTVSVIINFSVRGSLESVLVLYNHDVSPVWEGPEEPMSNFTNRNGSIWKKTYSYLQKDIRRSEIVNRS